MAPIDRERNPDPGFEFIGKVSGDLLHPIHAAPSLTVMSQSIYVAYPVWIMTSDNRIVIERLFRSGSNDAPTISGTEVARLMETCIDNPALGAVEDDESTPWMMLSWIGTDGAHSLNLRRLSIDRAADPISYQGYP
jgi:hypothetical protein